MHACLQHSNMFWSYSICSMTDANFAALKSNTSRGESSSSLAYACAFSPYCNWNSSGLEWLQMRQTLMQRACVAVQMAEMAAEQERLQSELRALRVAPPAASSPLMVRPPAGPSPLADKAARSTKLPHGSPAQRRRSPQRKACSPPKPSWNNNSSTAPGSGGKGKMRPPPPRVAPVPNRAGASFKTPRSARHRTPRTAIRGLVDKTLRRVSNATGNDEGQLSLPYEILTGSSPPAQYGLINARACKR